MAAYWTPFSLLLFTDLDKVKVGRMAKQGQGSYPAILTAEQAWLRIYYTAKRKFFLCAQRGKSVYCETFRSKTIWYLKAESRLLMM